jgi:hypothetical protein
MQRLTIELTGNKALRALKVSDHEQLIRIVSVLEICQGAEI